MIILLSSFAELQEKMPIIKALVVFLVQITTQLNEDTASVN